MDLLNGPWRRELARLPWGMVLIICAIAGFGLVVLYSAAGGSLNPWALKQGVRFVILLVGALYTGAGRQNCACTGGIPAEHERGGKRFSKVIVQGLCTSKRTGALTFFFENFRAVDDRKQHPR